MVARFGHTIPVKHTRPARRPVARTFDELLRQFDREAQDRALEAMTREGATVDVVVVLGKGLSLVIDGETVARAT